MSKVAGFFVSIDGPNGVGKSTLIKSIVKNIRKKRLSVHLTKEVTETSLGKFIREAHREYRGKTLALLVAADRQNHIESDILPALQSHDIVITDRYVQSSLVFQKLDGVELPFIWKINEDCLRPNLSLLITASADVIRSRMAHRYSFDRFEETCGREDEVRLYKEAMAFLRKKGFYMQTFLNENVSIPSAAEYLSNEILDLRRKYVSAKQSKAYRSG